MKWNIYWLVVVVIAVAPQAEELVSLGANPETGLEEIQLKLTGLSEGAMPLKMVRLPAGSFTMGELNSPVSDELTKVLSYPQRAELIRKFPQGDPARFAITVDHVRNGDFDERPIHDVTVSQPYLLSTCEITNAQYELFDPSHAALRGKNGFSARDDEAVVFVSWYEAKAFCDWLSERVGQPFRLPTEAEWEYACRAGTSTLFHTGDELPEAFLKNARRTSFDDGRDKVDTFVGRTPASPWGLFDMHGNVEEWCSDWYGPYAAEAQSDPVGRAEGDFKVARGGSHGTYPYFLRSANRMATLPENKHWLIGFRVVLGERPNTKPLPTPPPQRFQRNVNQSELPNARGGPKRTEPYFKGPREYVRIPEGSHGPLFSHHNHDTAIVACDNGDLLAIWYTCVEERGRELAVGGTRLRHGEEEWEQASLFWDVPDRNDHCPALWNDGAGTLYHFNGLCVAGKWEPLAIVMRTSSDHGVTWSKARLIVPEHGFRQMVGEPVFRTEDGTIAFGADTDGGSALWTSKDNGDTWSDAGGTIAGIHAGIAPLKDGRILAFGRGRNVDGRMPKSISEDGGKTWEVTASEFPPIRGGQRAVLLRLKEGPLFFASFDKERLFGALSYDSGETWPVRHFITDGLPDHGVNTFDGGRVRMNADSAEPLGYLSVCQSADGVIQLISSWQHYAFNQVWLESTPPQASSLPPARDLPVRGELAYLYDPEPSATGSASSGSAARWNFIAEGARESQVVQFPSPGVMKVTATERCEPRWSNERIDDFSRADIRQGFTAELAVQLLASSSDKARIGFELFVRCGALKVHRYPLTIMPTGVAFDGEPIARDMDNTSAMHRYRLAVREDTSVQIYRDNELLGVCRIDSPGSDWRKPARGNYIEWGIDGDEAVALMDFVAYDVRGAFQPSRR